MKTTTQRWLYGLGSAVIGGGSSAVTRGSTSMGFAPDKFNLANTSGVLHLLGLMFANFVVSGVLSAFFYLRQSPLPPEDVTQLQAENQMLKLHNGQLNYMLDKKP